jgi:hypothetical protein
MGIFDLFFPVELCADFFLPGSFRYSTHTLFGRPRQLMFAFFFTLLGRMPSTSYAEVTDRLVSIKKRKLYDSDAGT